MRIFKRKFAIHDVLLALVMAGFVAVPFAGAFWPGAHPSESNVEHRRLSPMPHWPTSFANWIGFPKAFDSFAHDRFGLRDRLLHGYRWLQAKAFHDSASPDAFVGRSGWLYLTENGSLADMQGTSPYTDAALRNTVEQINARGELLAVRGVRYGFVVFPDKHTIYPQFLPRGVSGGFARRRLNALDAAMAQTGHRYYFDATDALQRDASDSPFRLYYKSDTHWNPWGAWLGYQAWQAADGKRLGLKPFEYRFGQFRLSHHSTRGDLARMSGYRPFDPDVYPPSRSGCANSKRWNAPSVIASIVETIPSHLLISACAGSGSALVVHDSFMDSIARYVSASYARTWYVWKYLDDAAFGWLVQRLQPNVVIVERVERLMGHLPRVDLDVLVQKLGVIGERAGFDRQGNLVIGDEKNAKTYSSAPVAGSLQRMVRDGDRVHIEGWARLGPAPPAAVIAVADGRVVGEAPVTLYRPGFDVAKRAPVLAWSGFRLAVPVASLQGGALHLYLVDYGTWSKFPLDGDDRERLQHAVALNATMIGKSAMIGAGGELVVDDAVNGLQRSNQPTAGSLDKIVRQDGHVHLVGWVSIGKISPAAVLAVANGCVVGEAPIDRYRIDVATANKNPALAWSGFDLDVPTDALGPGDKELRLYFVGPGGYGEFRLGQRDRSRIRATAARQRWIMSWRLNVSRCALRAYNRRRSAA